MPAPINWQKLPVVEDSQVQSGQQEKPVMSAGERAGEYKQGARAWDRWQNVVQVNLVDQHIFIPVHNTYTNKTYTLQSYFIHKRLRVG